MGMFDNIVCKYPLPLTVEMDELKKFNLNERTYQTKDLECVLDYYEIHQDGTLWHEEYDVEDRSDPNAEGIQRIIGMHTRTNTRMVQMKEYTGTINFYEFIDYGEGDKDYWVEFAATFFNGILMKIIVAEFRATDNADRKASTAKFHKEMEERRILWNKWYIKYGYAYYDRFIHWIFVKYNKLQQKLPPAYKIERFFRPL